MHLIDHGRSHIEKTYKRPFNERIIRDFLSKILPNPTYFRIIGMLTLLVKPFQFFLPNPSVEPKYLDLFFGPI